MQFTTIQNEIQIDAKPELVWHQMLDKENYPRWTNGAWPGSMYTGSFTEGEEINFHGPDGEGLVALTEKLEPARILDLRYAALTKKGGEIDRDSEGAKIWQQARETYYFEEKNGGTLLRVELYLPEQWASMMNESWPVALKDLKENSENA